MPETILLVDDERVILEVVSDILTQAGYIVRTASNGLEALTLHTQYPADLIISDVLMPVIDGFTLLARLRQRDDQTPVLLMSAVPRRFPPVTGATFLQKPFDLEEILVRVADLLGDPSAS